MPDWGAGSPSAVPGASISHKWDWGAGSPTPSGWPAISQYELFIEGSAGSPNYHWQAIPSPLPDGTKFTDEGGFVVKLVGTLPIEGPFYIRLLDVTGQSWPSVGYAYGMRAGSPGKAYANKAKNELKFALPPVPPGAYDLQIAFDPGQVFVMEKAVIVVPRVRSSETYRVRNGFPTDPFKTGPRSAQAEPELP
jgi:hypothetical protein